MENEVPSGQTEQSDVQKPEEGMETMSLFLKSRVTGKGYHADIPQNEVVESALSYMALSLVRGEGIKMTVSDHLGEIINITTENREISGPGADEILGGDMIEIIKIVAQREAEQREAAKKRTRIIVAPNQKHLI